MQVKMFAVFLTRDRLEAVISEPAQARKVWEVRKGELGGEANVGAARVSAWG